jgi:hypothetical protein
VVSSDGEQQHVDSIRDLHRRPQASGIPQGSSSSSTTTQFDRKGGGKHGGGDSGDGASRIDLSPPDSKEENAVAASRCTPPRHAPPSLCAPPSPLTPPSPLSPPPPLPPPSPLPP